MSGWIEPFSFFIAGASMLLSMMGLWFTAVIPGIDRWSKRFFGSYFLIFTLCCLSGIIEVLFQENPVPVAIYHFLLLMEDLLLALPLPMMTVFLLHCCGESIHGSKLLCAVIGLFAVMVMLFAISAFAGGFYYLTPENRYYRGPLYPLLLLPAIMIQLLNIAGTIRAGKLLTRKAFIAFLIAMLPITSALIILLFVDIIPFVEISYILSALAMYSFILSDQLEQDRRQQQELLLQQQEIVRQQSEIANQRNSVMVLRMRPHFIYNTLMTIYGLCKIDPGKARQVTMDFTNYLRRNFHAVASDSAIPFSTELEHTRAYLAVEQAQYDDMLVVNLDTPFTNFRLPPLTLQPLVENAVKHGMDPDSEPLLISIRTQHSDSATDLIVEDNGRGFDPDETTIPGIALGNIRQRLELMCGGSLTIQSREGGGTVVTVTIPGSAERKKEAEEL
ncbi:MAG: histidine kinase [Lachnospiraceae bacterium]|nr:histidine kinase [Lachnospiraceae bacterium]